MIDPQALNAIPYSWTIVTSGESQPGDKMWCPQRHVYLPVTVNSHLSCLDKYQHGELVIRRQD